MQKLSDFLADFFGFDLIDTSTVTNYLVGIFELWLL